MNGDQQKIFFLAKNKIKFILVDIPKPEAYGDIDPKF